MDWDEPHVRNVGMTAAAVLAPDRRPFTVGKPTKYREIYHIFFSSGYVNGRLLSEMVQQHGMTLTGVCCSRVDMFGGKWRAGWGCAGDYIARE